MSSIDSELSSINKKFNDILHFLEYQSDAICSDITACKETYKRETGEDEEKLAEEVSNIRGGRREKIPEVSKESVHSEGDYSESSEDVLEGIESYIGSKKSDTREIVLRLKKSFERRNILYNSTLTNIISQVEIFFSEMFRLDYKRHPGKIDYSVERFSLNDIRDEKEFDRAKNEVITSKINDDTGGNFKDWVDSMESNLDIEMEHARENMKECLESHQRRNAIVHNDGLIDEYYLKETGEEYSYDGDVGEKMYSSKEYIDRKINLFHSICAITGVKIWKKWKEEDSLRGEFVKKMIASLSSKSNRFSYEGNTYISGVLGHFLMNDESASFLAKATGALNYWHLQKQKNSLDYIIEHIPEEKKNRYKNSQVRVRIGFYALMENVEEARKCIRDGLKSGNFNPEEIESYPLFEGIREKIPEVKNYN